MKNNTKGFVAVLLSALNRASLRMLCMRKSLFMQKLIISVPTKAGTL